MSSYVLPYTCVESGLASVSNVNLTSSAVNGSPLWNLTPLRSMKSICLPSALTLYDVARPGCLPSAVRLKRPSKRKSYVIESAICDSAMGLNLWLRIVVAIVISPLGGAGADSGKSASTRVHASAEATRAARKAIDMFPPVIVPGMLDVTGRRRSVRRKDKKRQMGSRFDGTHARNPVSNNMIAEPSFIFVPSPSAARMTSIAVHSRASGPARSDGLPGHAAPPVAAPPGDPLRRTHRESPTPANPSS